MWAFSFFCLGDLRASGWQQESQVSHGNVRLWCSPTAATCSSVIFFLVCAEVFPGTGYKQDENRGKMCFVLFCF